MVSLSELASIALKSSGNNGFEQTRTSLNDLSEREAWHFLLIQVISFHLTYSDTGVELSSYLCD